MASITVARDAGYTDSLRAYTVVLDGMPVGELGEAEVRTFQIEPGRHRLAAKVDWCGSRSITFDAAADDDVKFIVASNLRGAKVVFALFFIAFAWNAYLRLRQVEHLDGFVARQEPIPLDPMRFVLKHGVLGFGLGFWVLSLLFRYLDGDRLTLASMLFSLVLSLIAGAAWGAFMWRWFKRRFGAAAEARNARLAGALPPVAPPAVEHRSLRRR